MKLFLYGTLMELAGCGRCAGRPINASRPNGGRPATLPGYRRVTLRGAKYPTLRRSPGHAVTGVVIRVTADMLRRLHAYESIRYRQAHVRLRTERGLERARCFIGDAPTRITWTPDVKLMTLRSRTF